jgi:hypothetical protein
VEDASDYLSQSNDLVSWDASPNKLAAIISQKWIALNGISPMPIWTDFRRTGYPSFIHFSQDAARLNDQPPVRLLYPQTEVANNNEHIPANVSSAQDTFTQKIFWQNR